MNYQDIGKRIQQRRKELNLTQQELADQLKVTNKAISKWETGEGYPDISILTDISSALKVSVDELLGSNVQTLSSKSDEEIDNVSKVVNVTDSVDLTLIYRMILSATVPLIYFLPFFRSQIYLFDIIEVDMFTLHSGYEIIFQTPTNLTSFIIVLNLYTILLIILLFFFKYVLNYFKHIEIFPFLNNRKTNKIFMILLTASLLMPIYMAIQTGILIGLVILSLVVVIFIILENRNLLKKLKIIQ